MRSLVARWACCRKTSPSLRLRRAEEWFPDKSGGLIKSFESCRARMFRRNQPGTATIIPSKSAVRPVAWKLRVDAGDEGERRQGASLLRQRHAARRGLRTRSAASAVLPSPPPDGHRPVAPRPGRFRAENAANRDSSNRSHILLLATESLPKPTEIPASRNRSNGA